jgi:hypothetical protein
MAKRNVFYSFHYEPDNWRASQVRKIGGVEGNSPASDNDWEKITSEGDDAIKRWIAKQMKGRSCTVVLVGENTANRPWINYEIEKSWNDGMGVVGIRIHGLLDKNGLESNKGENPFKYVKDGSTGEKLSSIVKCYNPKGEDSKERYSIIEDHLKRIIEEAIKIRKEH